MGPATSRAIAEMLTAGRKCSTRDRSRPLTSLSPKAQLFATALDREDSWLRLACVGAAPSGRRARHRARARLRMGCRPSAPGSPRMPGVVEQMRVDVSRGGGLRGHGPARSPRWAWESCARTWTCPRQIRWHSRSARAAQRSAGRCRGRSRPSAGRAAGTQPVIARSRYGQAPAGAGEPVAAARQPRAGRPDRERSTGAGARSGRCCAAWRARPPRSSSSNPSRAARRVARRRHRRSAPAGAWSRAPAGRDARGASAVDLGRCR